MTPLGPLNPRVRLARNLRYAREHANGGRGFSQGEAGERLGGKTRQTINRWEREEENSPAPGEVELAQAAALYGTTVPALRYGTVTPSGLVVREGHAGLAGADRSKDERAWLARFKAELIEADATDAIADAADALARSTDVRLFYRVVTADEDPVAPMEWIASAIRELVAERAGRLDASGPAGTSGTGEAPRRRVVAKRRPEPPQAPVQKPGRAVGDRSTRRP